ncbi:hypothetical protein HZA87_03000 [Candidatus Uhrbacteria bacterium]|nr:hypothetical protein [Candidatus Uhrbacteria bacterium]
MCENAAARPTIACDFRDRSSAKKERDHTRDSVLTEVIAHDSDPKKANALRFWRDSVLSRLYPRRDTPNRMLWQLARLPKEFLPFVETAGGRVLFGPANEVHVLTSFTARVKDVSPSTYVKGERIVPPQENAATLECYS